ncbi:7065_t:CDS:1, partial [Scutellospora calospora]
MSYIEKYTSLKDVLIKNNNEDVSLMYLEASHYQFGDEDYILDLEKSYEIITRIQAKGDKIYEELLSYIMRSYCEKLESFSYILRDEAKEI